MVNRLVYIPIYILSLSALPLGVLHRVLHGVGLRVLLSPRINRLNNTKRQYILYQIKSGIFITF